MQKHPSGGHSNVLPPLTDCALFLWDYIAHIWANSKLKEGFQQERLFLLPIQSQKVHGRMRQGNKPLERKVLHTDPVGCSSGILGYPTSSGKGRAGGISSQRVPELQMKLHLGHLSMFSDESPHDMWPCPTVHPSDLAVAVVYTKNTSITTCPTVRPSDLVVEVVVCRIHQDTTSSTSAL